MSKSHSSLPADLALTKNMNQLTGNIIEWKKILYVTEVSDLSQNGEDTPRHSHRSFNIREALHLECHGSAARSPKSPKSEGQRQVIEQFEPGVYVTLVQLQNGTKIFKQVKFRYLLLFS
ncbi:hypothetical protein Vadar_029275 [Vaccinium darrowii]|uniref:Uncharacterized protein n=1 Tax=Vaccinium darrowii TaxID=229202 RepID=A0ACB7YZV5_9ERIC|nr:hypothetical protein Vadar_029275 [Vaccinium darrowii]